MSYNLKLKNDIIFKAFFSRHENYLESFLSAILNRKIKIKRVLHDVRLEQLTRDMKYGVLDLEVILENEEIVNVEMQLKDNKNIEKRTTFYASKKIVEQLEPGEHFENLKKVIIITILDYSLTDFPEYLIDTDRVITTHKDHTINNDVKYYYIELDKFRNQNPDMKDTLNQWLSFLDMERGDLLEMAKEENKEIKEAFEEYEVLTGDAAVKRLAELKRMSELEEHSALTVAKQEGIQEGEKSGIQKGKLSIIQNLLNSGIKIDEISKITGLSQEEINDLLDNKNILKDNN